MGTVNEKNAGVVKNQYKFLKYEPVIGLYSFFDMDSGMCGRYSTMRADFRHLTGRLHIAFFN